MGKKGEGEKKGRVKEKKKKEKEKKKSPSSRIRTSDLWISMHFKPLQSTALPTELSKATR